MKTRDWGFRPISWCDQIHNFVDEVIGESVCGRELAGGTHGHLPCSDVAAFGAGIAVLNAIPFWASMPNAQKIPQLARLVLWSGLLTVPPPWVKAELAMQGGVQSGDASNVSVHHRAPGRAYNRMAGLNQGQLFEPAGNFTMTSVSGRGSEEGANQSSDTCWDVRTLCQAGRLKEALHILNQGGISVDSNIYLCLLQQCIKTKDLERGKNVHVHMFQSGIKPNIFLLSTLMNMYAKCGSVVNARKVFDKMPERDVLARTIMMAGYAKHGCAREAFQIYEQMIEDGVMPNRVTFICVLKACVLLGMLRKGKEIHADIINAGIELDIILETALVDMYAKCGSIRDARQVFDNMAHRNVVSWSAMIAAYAHCGCGKEAFGMYQQMIWEGVTPNRVTFICVLNACANLAVLEKGKEVHADFITSGIKPDIILETALVDMYAKCGSMKDACQIFNNMAKQNVVSWSAMIAGYAQHGCGREALDIYEQLQREGVRPDRITFICVLNACASLGALAKGKEVHADIIKAGIPSCVNLENTLVDVYAKCGGMKEAREVFKSMNQRDVVSWSTIIAGYAQHGCGGEALDMYEQMIQKGLTPDRVTVTCILNACASLGALEKGKEVHAGFIKAGIEPDGLLETALANMYSKCGSMKEARMVFDNMAQRDAVSWSSIIAGYAQHGCGREAFEMYVQMQWEGVQPDSVTFIYVLSACATLAALEKGKGVHADIIKAGISPDIILETALADMYAKSGSMKDAHEVFNNMTLRNVVTWNAMIAGYARTGCGREALKLFEQMQQDGIKLDGITFTCLLSACSHGGLVEEGRYYFDSMSRVHDVTPTVEHFSCMVDLFGRAGQLEKAQDIINKMPIEPGASLWGALLGACRVHGDVKLAEHAAKCLLEWGPQHAPT